MILPAKYVWILLVSTEILISQSPKHALNGKASYEKISVLKSSPKTLRGGIKYQTRRLTPLEMAKNIEVRVVRTQKTWVCRALVGGGAPSFKVRKFVQRQSPKSPVTA